MKLKNEQIAGMLKAGYDRFVEANGMQDSPHMRAGFFAGAAVALASQDASKEVVEAVSSLALAALKR
jgi:hypothetical protein